jgi:hypothetical protein
VKRWRKPRGERQRLSFRKIVVESSRSQICNHFKIVLARCNPHVISAYNLIAFIPTTTRKSLLRLFLLLQHFRSRRISSVQTARRNDRSIRNLRDKRHPFLCSRFLFFFTRRNYIALFHGQRVQSVVVVVVVVVRDIIFLRVVVV